MLGVTMDILEVQLNSMLRPEYRKVWVEYVDLKKRNPMMFTIFPYDHGDYILRHFELKPALRPLNPDTEDWNKEWSLYQEQFDVIREFLTDYVE